MTFKQAIANAQAALNLLERHQEGETAAAKALRQAIAKARPYAKQERHSG